MIRASLVGLSLMALGAASAQAQPSCNSQFCIGWSSINSGGTLQSESAEGNWRLGGTIGQWDATGTGELASESWRLTGGFWAVTLDDPGDEIFRDAFQLIVNGSQTERIRRSRSQ